MNIIIHYISVYNNIVLLHNDRRRLRYIFRRYFREFVTK
jgi:hypothetical protein